MKKKIIAALCIIAVFIPTYLAIAYYMKAQNAPVTEKTVDSLTVSDINGNRFVFDKKTEDSKEMIRFFVEMNDHAKTVSELPSQLRDSKYYEAVYSSYNKDKKYKYYFVPDGLESYFIDPQGKVYNIKKDDASRFLSTKYAESLYPAAYTPTLKVSDSSILPPTTIDWKYKTASGSFLPASYTGNGNTPVSYPVSGNLNLAFSVEPDYVNIKITEGTNIIYNGLYSELSASVIGEKNKTYTVEIHAKWYENAEKNNYGEAKYQFTANVSAPAVFYLGKQTIEQGEFVVLTGKNVIDKNAITFTSTPSINYTPVFYEENDYVVALIPISLALEYNDKYTFKITANGATQELNLSVTERKPASTLVYKVTADVAKLRTAATIQEFKNALKSTVEKNETVRYWDGLFTEAIDTSKATGPKILTGFGRIRRVEDKNTGKLIEEYTHTGVDYVYLYDTTEVLAANKGKVVYIGEQKVSGRLVVIDHGYGLKSWYMHMGSINVGLGDIVEKGAVIGTAGKTGFTQSINLHHEMTVNGVSVSPYVLQEEGIKMYLD